MKIVIFAICLFLAIMFGFTCIGRLIRGQSISYATIALMSLGLVGVIIFLILW